MTELIKTRKQYIETLDFLKINRFAYDEANEIDDLIEASRKLARAAQLNETHHAEDELHDALVELPDWIKEDG